MHDHAHTWATLINAEGGIAHRATLGGSRTNLSLYSTYYDKGLLSPVPKTGQYPKKLVYKFGPLAFGWQPNGNGPPAPTAEQIGLIKRRAAAKGLLASKMKQEMDDIDEFDDDDSRSTATAMAIVAAAGQRAAAAAAASQMGRPWGSP